MLQFNIFSSTIQIDVLYFGKTQVEIRCDGKVLRRGMIAESISSLKREIEELNQLVRGMDIELQKNIRNNKRILITVSDAQDGFSQKKVTGGALINDMREIVRKLGVISSPYVKIEIRKPLNVLG